MRTRAVCCMCAAAIVGIYVGTGTSPPPLWIWLFSLGLLALSIGTSGHAAVATGIVASFFLGNLYVREWQSLHRTKCPLTLNTDVVVVDAPDIRKEAALLTVGIPGSGKAIVTAPLGPPYEYGEKLHVTGQVFAPEPFNGFDYPLFLERAGICGLVRRGTVRPSAPASPSIRGSLFSLRARLQRTITRAIPEPEASFLGGILLGSKRSIPDSVQEQLKATGTTHIIAISGANITILLDLLLLFLPLYGLRSQYVATLGISVFMCLLTGGSASVLRGAIVASIGRYVRLRGRRLRPLPLLLSSMLGFLLFNPLLLKADPGFQLSYAAYGGLLFFGKPLGSYVDRTPIVRRLPEFIRGAFTETAAATAGCAPVSYHLFGKVVLLGLIVNPLILWLLPAITLLGLLLLGFGFFPPVIALVRYPLWLMLHAVLQGIGWFAVHYGGIPP